ncbi:MAG: CopG family transcriptional regulator [Planctomycetota bacterium]|nr:MAG: CopG family transcriptional regulator [Planctomycetota bacterium]
MSPSGAPSGAPSGGLSGDLACPPPVRPPPVRVSFRWSFSAWIRPLGCCDDSPSSLDIMMRIMMVANMRTTVNLDDDVLVILRRRAAAGGVSVSQVLNRAVRRGLAEDESRRVAAPTVTYGSAVQALTAHELAQRVAQVDNEDLRHQAGL